MIADGSGRFTGRVVLVTGAAQGQGAAEAAAFASEGATVVLGDVSDKEGARVADALGSPHRYRHLDVRDAAGWHGVVEETVATLGGIDVLVNNAGIMRSGDLLEQPETDVVDVIGVNLIGTILGLQAVGRAMKRAGRGGVVVNISSSSGRRPGARTVAYSASKWGVRGASQAAAADLAAHGIRVNTVLPGAIDTPMLGAAGLTQAAVVARHGSRLLLPRLGTVQEVAELVLFVSSSACSHVTGAEFVIDGGLTTAR